MGGRPRPSGRTNSLSGVRNNSIRSNSIRNNSMRTSSLRNNYHNAPIIIHTTKTEDEFGRTKSITTETIQQFGSFEIVKREIQEITQPRPLFKAAYAESFELGSIREEEEDAFESFSGNGVGKSPQKNDDDGESIYSDAQEVQQVQQVQQVNQGQQLQQVNQLQQMNQLQQLQEIQEVPVQNVRFKDTKKLTEEEMYEKALEVARKRVFGDENKQNHNQINQINSEYNHKNFKSSLRGEKLEKKKFSLKKFFQKFSGSK